MAHAQKTSHISLIGLVCALGLRGSQLPFDQALFVSRPGGRTGGVSARGAEGHGDDDEDDEEQEPDEEEEDGDEDDEDDEEEPWQVRPLTDRQAQTRTAGRPLCALSPPAALRSRISP